MQNFTGLLYQIRGLARSVVAFVLFYQGVIPILLLFMSGSSLSDASWRVYVDSLLDVGLATWLIIAFTNKKPLWASSSFLILSLLSVIIFSPNHLASGLETTSNTVALTIPLLTLMLIDFNILNFQKTQTQQRNIRQYMHVTRDRMLYAFIKRLELKDIPPVMHRLAKSRIKRHLRNRSQTKPQKEIPKSND
jgi:hypothetical protein